MARNTWLITGVAGFVGSSIAKHLLECGDKVVGIDNLYSGQKQNLPQHQDFDFHEIDITSPDFARIIKAYDINHVLHLAAIVSVSICEQYPDLARKVNVDGLNNIFSAVKDKAIEKFVYASSSAVYGASEAMPISEDVIPEPISVYGETKLQNDADAENFAKRSGIPCVGLRFFNLFGGNPEIKNAYAAVIPIWLNAIKNEEPVIIYGEGDATRDFCYIDNVAQSIDCISKADISGHQIFNIGTQRKTTLNELFVMLCDICGKHPEPEYKPWRSTDILHSCADISKAKEILDYHPDEDVYQSLKKWLA
jgi:UDP-N-acetylglucosamine 4-epimerase